MTSKMNKGVSVVFVLCKSGRPDVQCQTDVMFLERVLSERLGRRVPRV